MGKIEELERYITDNISKKLSQTFKGSKPFFEKEGDRELKFRGIPKYFIIPKTTLNDIYKKWEEYKYDMEKTTDWLAERILTKLSCAPPEPKDTGKVIVLMGHTGSGKTTLKDMLIKNNIAQGITTYTTREPREEETPFDYHFIKEDDFLEKMDNDFFIETSKSIRKVTSIDVNGEIIREEKEVLFGSAKDDYKGENLKVIILDGQGYLNIKDKIPCIPIFVKASEDTLIQRCLARGDSKEKVLTRLKNDDFTSLLESENVNIINTEDEIPVIYNNLLTLVNKKVLKVS